MPCRGVGAEVAAFDFPADFEIVHGAGFFAVLDDPDVHGSEVPQGFGGIAAGGEEGGDECGEGAEDEGHDADEGVLDRIVVSWDDIEPDHLGGKRIEAEGAEYLLDRSAEMDDQAAETDAETAA